MTDDRALFAKKISVIHRASSRIAYGHL